MSIEDTFEMLIEVLDCYGTQFVENAAYFYAGIGMWIRAILSCHEKTIYTTHPDGSRIP